jgi:hypothetical protein
MPILYSMDASTGSQRTRWIIVAAAGVLMLIGAWRINQRPPAASDADPVTTITSLDQLQAAFNADAGKPRLILLFAPT